MPAHKALNIDNFHDAAVKVGMYKNAVIAFMHPYTLGALATSISKTGGAFGIDADGARRYRGVELVPREFWSKDDVTFCVEQAAGIKDAVARGALKVQDWQAHVHGEIEAAARSLTRLSHASKTEFAEAAKAYADNEVTQRMVEIETAEVNDVTGELELSKAKWQSEFKATWQEALQDYEEAPLAIVRDTKRTISLLHAELCSVVRKTVEAAKQHHKDPIGYMTRELLILAYETGHGRLSTVSQAAFWAKKMVESLKLTSQSGDLLMDAADKLIDAVEAHDKSQRFAESGQVAYVPGVVAAEPANVGPALQKALNERKTVGKRY